MNIFAHKLFFLLCILFLLAPGGLTGKQKSGNSDEVIRLNSVLVLLEADVLNKRTNLAISGLKKENFTLYEDGVKQEITHFSQDKLPISLLILLDVSGSVWPRLNKLREGAMESLQTL